MDIIQDKLRATKNFVTKQFGRNNQMNTNGINSNQIQLEDVDSNLDDPIIRPRIDTESIHWLTRTYSNITTLDLAQEGISPFEVQQVADLLIIWKDTLKRIKLHFLYREEYCPEKALSRDPIPIILSWLISDSISTLNKLKHLTLVIGNPKPSSMTLHQFNVTWNFSTFGLQIEIISNYSFLNCQMCHIICNQFSDKQSEECRLRVVCSNDDDSTESSSSIHKTQIDY